jgi:hypothetical protein
MGLERCHKYFFKFLGPKPPDCPQKVIYQSRSDQITVMAVRCVGPQAGWAYRYQLSVVPSPAAYFILRVARGLQGAKAS